MLPVSNKRVIHIEGQTPVLKDYLPSRYPSLPKLAHKLYTSIRSMLPQPPLSPPAQPPKKPVPKSLKHPFNNPPAPAPTPRQRIPYSQIESQHCQSKHSSPVSPAPHSPSAPPLPSTPLLPHAPLHPYVTYDCVAPYECMEPYEFVDGVEGFCVRFKVRRNVREGKGESKGEGKGQKGQVREGEGWGERFIREWHWKLKKIRKGSRYGYNKQMFIEFGPQNQNHKRKHIRRRKEIIGEKEILFEKKIKQQLKGEIVLAQSQFQESLRKRKDFMENQLRMRKLKTSSLLEDKVGRMNGRISNRSIQSIVHQIATRSEASYESRFEIGKVLSIIHEQQSINKENSNRFQGPSIQANEYRPQAKLGQQLPKQFSDRVRGQNQTKKNIEIERQGQIQEQEYKQSERRILSRMLKAMTNGNSDSGQSNYDEDYYHNYSNNCSSGGEKKRIENPKQIFAQNKVDHAQVSFEQIYSEVPQPQTPQFFPLRSQLPQPTPTPRPNPQPTPAPQTIPQPTPPASAQEPPIITNPFMLPAPAPIISQIVSKSIAKRQYYSLLSQESLKNNPFLNQNLQPILHNPSTSSAPPSSLVPPSSLAPPSSLTPSSLTPPSSLIPPPPPSSLTSAPSPFATPFAIPFNTSMQDQYTYNYANYSTGGNNKERGFGGQGYSGQNGNSFNNGSNGNQMSIFGFGSAGNNQQNFIKSTPIIVPQSTSSVNAIYNSKNDTISDEYENFTSTDQNKNKGKNKNGELDDNWGINGRKRKKGEPRLC